MASAEVPTEPPRAAELAQAPTWVAPPTLDFAEPLSLCDRFISPVDRTHCQEVVRRQKPDSYAASLCQLDFEDSAFYECLQLAGKSSFNPLQIQSCGNEDLTDRERWSCFKKYTGTPEFQRFHLRAKRVRKKDFRFN